MRRHSPRLLVALSAFAAGAFAQVTVTVTPSTASVHAGTFVEFRAAVTGTTSTGVTWAVNGILNGNSTLGTMSGGRYTPPVVPPVPNTVTITATSVFAPASSGSAAATVTNPYAFIASVSPAVIPSGAFTLTVNGSGFISGAIVKFGTTALATTFVSSTRLTATGTAPKNFNGTAGVTVTNPEPGTNTSDPFTVSAAPKGGGGKRVVTESAAARFLEQAAFGPDSASIDRVSRIGFTNWIDEQFAAPVSPWQNPSTIGYGIGALQSRFFTNAVHGGDQLRQRVAFALSQIWVVSGVDISNPWRLVPYLRVMQSNAFGNYRTLMRAVTLNVGMGEYLDMRNNSKADLTRGTLPNENYSREFLQLFTIGTTELNLDGTPKVDAASVPIPAYGQTAVAEFARVFTGWTYPTMPGATPLRFNPAYYEGDMVAFESNHDNAAKTLLRGAVLPAAQLADKDLNDALDNVFNHSNVGPFVAKNLIGHLVKSNPTPAYVQRVATGFNNNGAGVRGDLKAVVKAILLDAEARAGDATATPASTDGHLQEPVLFAAAAMRGLGAMVNDTNSLASRCSTLGQNVLSPASVFNYFSPFYRVSAALAGPEFQIHTRNTAIERANFVNSFIFSSLGAGAVVDLAPWAALAPVPADLVNKVDAAFFHGQMPPSMKSEMINAVTNTTTGNTERARTALYLALSSSYYWVQH